MTLLTQHGVQGLDGVQDLRVRLEAADAAGNVPFYRLTPLGLALGREVMR
ncbi:MAG: hypothetical protein ABR562_05550 [Thermoplasmatota archaeon]|nr:hypothetical protein [Halobacteriales archaeon]